MCITKTEAWQHGGQLFATEEQAIDAALNDLGALLLKDHHSNLAIGLIEHAEKITRLLGRKMAIVAAKPKAEVVRLEDAA